MVIEKCVNFGKSQNMEAKVRKSKEKYLEIKEKG